MALKPRATVGTSLRDSLVGWGAVGTTRRVAELLLRRSAGACRALAHRALAPQRRGALASRARRELLAPNAQLRDSARGRRSFVLGSGPSTLGQDLSLLRGQTVLAVNEMFLRLQRDGVAPAVLLFQDQAYLEETPGHYRFLADFAAAAVQSGAVALVPAAAAPAVAARGLFRQHPPHYFASAGRLLDYPTAAATPPLDFTLPLPGMGTVTHTALALALYMGCDDIVLLGVDLDYLRQPRAPIRHGYGRNPYHDRDELSALQAFASQQGWDCPALLEHTAVELREYARLGEIAARLGRRVFNSSPGSLLGAFEQRPFASWFPPRG
jgi:hypothetical protein